MLKTEWKKYHKVVSKQSLEEIAAYYSVSPYLLAKRNTLTAPPVVGQVLEIPVERGHRYVVREGDTKALLCGNERAYEEKNGTDVFYIGMTVIL